MIRINLAKGQGSSKKKGGRAPGGKRGGPVFLIVLLLLAAGGGAYYYLTEIAPASKAVEEPVKVSLPPPVPKDDAKALPPSSRVRTNMAEDVVRETGGETRAAASKLNAEYTEMTAAEKINYEALFARNVFDMVSRCTPPGIRFRSLEVENFQSVYASGAGLSRQMVQEMFAAYKNERGEILPKPLSHIKDDEKGNYMFVITFKTRFGQEVSDRFQAVDHIGFKESLPQSLKDFSRIAKENGYKLLGQNLPQQVSVERAGEYRRTVYKASGMSTYRDFHKFVLALYNEKVPCALKKVSMVPVRDEEVRISVEVLFTVKE